MLCMAGRPTSVTAGRRVTSAWRTTAHAPLTRLARAIRLLPTRQVVAEDWPHPAVELVTVAATLKRG
jgi:hypothetical protein